MNQKQLTIKLPKPEMTRSFEVGMHIRRNGVITSVNRQLGILTIGDGNLDDFNTHMFLSLLYILGIKSAYEALW